MGMERRKDRLHLPRPVRADERNVTCRSTNPSIPAKSWCRNFWNRTGCRPAGWPLELWVPANRITAIINGQRGISGDTALRLAKFFGNTPAFWMNLQSQHQLELAERKSGEEIRRRIRSRPLP